MRTLRKNMMPKVAVVVLLMMGAVFTMGAFMAAGAVEATNDNNNETAITTTKDDAAGDDEIMSDSSSSSYTTISFGSSPSSSTTNSTSPPFSTDSECDPSYPDNCISPPPPILTCDDISFRKFEVVGTDPHGFDGDKDGIGCEVPPATAITPFQAQQQQQEPQQQNQTQNRTPTTTTTNANATTKTDGLLTTSINGTRFTTNQTILINGTLGGGEAAGAGGVLYIELRNPQNETLLYESINMTTGTFDTPFSYRLVAGDLEKNSGASRTIFKPMNETGDNYMMTVGYDGTASNNSRSEVQFVFAYEHLAPEGEERAAVATTTPEEPEPEPEVEPEPEEEVSEEDGEDCDNSYPDVCIPPPPPDLDCGDIDEENFEVRGSNPHGFDDDNDGVGCEEDDSTTSLEEEELEPEPEEEPLSELERLLEEREEQEVEEE
jgi:hypothetical protein